MIPEAILFIVCFLSLNRCVCVSGQTAFLSLSISNVSEMALTHYIKQLVTRHIEENVKCVFECQGA